MTLCSQSTREETFKTNYTKENPGQLFLAEARILPLQLVKRKLRRLTSEERTQSKRTESKK